MGRKFIWGVPSPVSLPSWSFRQQVSFLPLDLRGAAFVKTKLCEDFLAV